MENQVKSFLDEGYDFIEESCSTEPLTFTEADKDIIVESSEGKKSSYHILGTCKGVFQSIDEPSRNGRIYEHDHWQYQISKPEVQERLQNRQMLGQIGHRDARVDDLTISRGEVSHVVTVMEVREDANGKPYLYGELEILDTPAGRILKGLYEGGVGLYISSRGAGKLEDMPGQLCEGGRPLKKVSKTSYFLETWDIVKAPGFLKARPVYESAVSEDKKEAVHESVEETSQLTPNKVSTNEDITTLKSQIDKLAKIVEKVVDDVYEEGEPAAQATAEPTSEAQEEPKQKVMAEKPAESKQMQEQPIAPVQKEKANEALADFVSLMASTNISEEAFEEIIDAIAKAKKENK